MDLQSQLSNCSDFSLPADTVSRIMVESIINSNDEIADEPTIYKLGEGLIEIHKLFRGAVETRMPTQPLTKKEIDSLELLGGLLQGAAREYNRYVAGFKLFAALDAETALIN